MEHLLHGKRIVFPKDSVSKGTWVAASDDGTVACLLNGAFVKHQRAEHYAKSRGLVLLDFFRYATLEQFTKDYSLEGIEPFTMIILQNGLHELRWTGKETLHEEFSETTPMIWSSSTLYTEDVKKNRESWYKTWLSQNPGSDASVLRKFHKEAGDGDVYNNLKINRGDIQTLSITSVTRDQHTVQLHYEDLLENALYKPLSLDIVNDFKTLPENMKVNQ